MDIFADPSKQLSTYLSVREAFIASVLKNSIQRQTDLHRYVRAMLMSLINWMNGAGIHKTVLANAFLTNHSDILNPILSVFAKLVGHTIHTLLRCAIDTGILNEEDMSSDAIQQKLLFHFESDLEIDRFFTESKSVLKNDSQLILAFDSLVSILMLLRSSTGDVISSLDYARECLVNVTKNFTQLSSFLAFHPADNEHAQEYGMFPFVEPGITIFPPRDAVVFCQEGLVEFISTHCIPQLERFLAIMEMLDGVQLFLFFSTTEFDLHRDILTRICVVNWLKKMYELHWSSYETLFSFPFEMDHDLLHSFIIWTLFQCRNLSWIHRKTAEFTTKVLQPIATIKQSKEKEKNDFVQILLNESYLKQIAIGLKISLYSEKESILMLKIMRKGILVQQTLWPNCSSFQSNLEFRKEQVAKQSKELEKAASKDKLSQEDETMLKKIIEKRLSGTKIAANWNIVMDELFKN